MKKTIISVIAIFFAITLNANPLWMRYNTISPTGDHIAFSYKGDIYVVPAAGGEAHQLTTTTDYEYAPIFSPDGKTVAFATNRNGNFDIYTVAISGGEAKRVTTYSGSEMPLAFSPDGKNIYYATYMQKSASNVQFPSGWISELYAIPVAGGRPTQVLENPVMNMTFVGTDGSFIYENRTGSENNWRKHHVSSVARNLFLYDANTKTHKQLTTNVGEDRNPIYTPDGKVLFLSERNGGDFNVYLADQNNMEQPQPLTTFNEDHPVRFLSQAQNGTICFGYRGEIYTMKVGEKPVRVNITISNDQATDQNSTISGTPSEIIITPDGSQVIFTARGEVFATTDEYATTKQITETAEAERAITISPDGRTIVFASERSGQWNIYKATMQRDEEVNFANATLINEELLINDTQKERIAPQFSPDGKEIAFLEERRKLMVYNIETKKTREIMDGSLHVSNDHYGFDFKWSPDCKWFAVSLSTNKRAPYSDIAIVSAVDGKAFHNITSSGYMDVSPEWVMDGNAILFISNRYGMRSHASWGSQDDVFIAFLNQEAYDEFRLSKEEADLLKKEKKRMEELEKEGEKEEEKEKKEEKKDDDKEDEEETIEIDFDNIDERIMRLTPMSANMASAAITNDGKKLYFTASYEKSDYDLWELDLKTKGMKVVKKGTGYASLQFTEDGKTLYVLGRKTMKIAMSGLKTTPIATSASFTMNLAEEREYMFNHVFLQQTKRFYKEDYHGVNLPKLKKEYAPFLPHINNNYDFSEMLSEILGELNVSHTGSGYRAPSKKGADVTANLGLIYDLSYNEDGLMVDEIIENSPFDKKSSKLKKGMVIEKIDGKEIKQGEDYYPLLNKKAGKRTLITIYDPATKERWEEVIEPVTLGAIQNSLYNRWVDSRKEETERLSGGRLGYVHIRSMGDASYRTIYNDILGKYNQYDGVVIDTRFNGGGRLHEDIEILFSGEKYLEQTVRGEHYCDMPSRRYNKRSIMLIGEANYSNAHGTPWVYKYKNMGSLVGMPVPGTMTSVNWETLQDATMYFGIPVVGYKTIEGEYLENLQLEPDVKIANTPEKLMEGKDEQLEAAVKELLRQLDTEPSKW